MGVAPMIARLRERCKNGGMPVIHANDNPGRWRSGRRQPMGDAQSAAGDGARSAGSQCPDLEDYIVLKPLHSAFFGRRPV